MRRSRWDRSTPRKHWSAQGHGVVGGVALALGALGCAGCAPMRTTFGAPSDMTQAPGGGGAPARGMTPGMMRGSVEGKVTLLELDQMTHAYADRYTTLISSACDALEQDNPSLDQRRMAHRFKLITITSVYDIATNADPFTQLIDMLLVVTLESQVWIDEDRAGEIFGDRAQELIGPLRRAREDIWTIGARVMTPEQLEGLDFMIWDWRKHNPDVQMVALVRFGDFAASRGKSVVADVKAGGGFLAPVDEAKKAVDEARLLGERVFYLSKRMPFLVGWQAEAVANELLANPEVERALTNSESLARSADRLVALGEKLPEEAAELRAVVTETRALVEAAAPLTASGERVVTGLRDASEALTRTIDAADRLYDKAMPPGASDATSERFDLERAADRLTATIQELNGLLASSERLLVSDAWTKRMDEIDTRVRAQMHDASSRGGGLVDRAFWRAIILLGAFFVMLTVYRAASLALRARWAPAHGGEAGDGAKARASA